jgi:hypothetical protein
LFSAACFPGSDHPPAVLLVVVLVLLVLPMEVVVVVMVVCRIQSVIWYVCTSISKAHVYMC